MAATTIAKIEAIELIQGLAEDVTLEQIIDALEIKALWDEGEADVQAGRVISHSDLVREHAEWRKSIGHREPNGI